MEKTEGKIIFCKDTEHNFVKIAEKKVEKYAGNANTKLVNVYLMCCTKCGKVIEISDER